MAKADAILEEQDGRPALRFERLLEHPPERVWQALTDPDEQAAWTELNSIYQQRFGIAPEEATPPPERS